MQRSAGVSTIAIVALMGSILILAAGLLTVGFALVMPQFPPRPDRPALHPAAFLLFGSLTYVLPGIWGVVSGIGLWRLRNWARISTIVFAILAGICGLMGVAIAFVFFAIPVPTSDRFDPEAMARAMAIARGVILAISMVLVGISIWWGGLLTRPRVARQFTGATDPAGGGINMTAPGRRPLSITIVAVLMLIGTPFGIIGALFRTPVPFFTTILTGGAVIAYGLALTGTLIYCGWGLFSLKPAARLVAIGYLIFGLVNSSVFFLAPGREARFTELFARQHAAFPFMTPTAPTQNLPAHMAMIFGLVIGVAGAAVQIYFLATRRAAFETASSDPVWPDAPPV